jgi:hypothetical protein
MWPDGRDPIVMTELREKKTAELAARLAAGEELAPNLASSYRLSEAEAALHWLVRCRMMLERPHVAEEDYLFVKGFLSEAFANAMEPKVPSFEQYVNDIPDEYIESLRQNVIRGEDESDDEFLTRTRWWFVVATQTDNALSYICQSFPDGPFSCFICSSKFSFDALISCCDE